MKSFIVFALFVAAAVAAPQVQRTADGAAEIIALESDNIGTGPYSWLLKTSNGISADESGNLENPGSENEAIAVRGSFSYTGDDGVVYTVTYIADRNGFQPQGAHLPQA